MLQAKNIACLLIFSLFMLCFKCGGKLNAQSKEVGETAWSGHAVRFATYSAPYLDEEKIRDAVFNKYRRTLIANIAQKENWIVTFADNVCEGDIGALFNGEVDVLCTQHKDTAPDWGYVSEEAIYIEHHIVMAKESDTRFINGDLAALGFVTRKGLPTLSSGGTIPINAVVGYYGDDGKNLMTRFSGLCRAAGGAVAGKEFIGPKQMEDSLINGDIDLCIMGVHDIPDGFKAIYNMGSSPVYFLCRDAELKRQIDHAMSVLKSENPFFMVEYMKLVGGGGSLNAGNFNAGEIDFVKYSRQTKPIQVLVHSKSAPFSEIDDAGNFTGLDAAFWQKMSFVSGLKFRYIDADKYKRDYSTDYLRITCANGWRLHADYKRYSPVILTRRCRVYARPGYDVRSFKRSNSGSKTVPGGAGQGKNGAAVISLTREQRVILPYLDRWFREYEVMLCNSPRDCLEKTSNGISDMAIIDESFLRSMHNINEYPRLASKRPLLLNVPISIEIKGPHTDLIDSILHKSLSQIPLEYFERENIAAQIDMGYVPSRHTMISRNAVGVAIFAFLLGTGLLSVSLILSHRYKRLSETDEVTGLCNLSKFQSMADKLINDSIIDNVLGDTSSVSASNVSSSATFALASISILGFRHLNNTFGYEWGKRLLRVIADCLRQIDSFPMMLVTHCYDDIFYCFIRCPAGEKDYEQDRLNRITSLISNHVAKINDTLVKAGFHVVVKSSIVYSPHAESIQSMMDKADWARESVSSESVNSRDKDSYGQGEGNFAVFDSNLEKQRENENNIERHIVQAFENNELVAVYQPKIDLRTGRLEGAEAFARWNSPDMGVMMPNNFLPVFEKNGYALRFNFSIFMNVLSFLQSIIDRGDMPLPISMNVTHININSTAFIRRFEDIFSRYNVPRSLIEFELSERSIGMSRTELQRLSILLHEKGFSVAIDDFGTGGSSLSLLDSVPADVVKFDQRFFSNSDTSNGSKIILTQLVQMSHLLGRKVVCKCVEKKSQLEFLRSVGCDIVQGRYYSNALSPDDFRDYMDGSI